MRKVLRVVFYVFGPLVLISSFQNCGKVSFSPVANNQTGLASSAGDDNNTPSNPTPGPTPTPQVPVCASGQIFNGTGCVPCQSYVQLTNTSGNIINVPAQDTSATCYYTHLINGVDMSGAVNSNTWQTFRTDVWARHHSTNNESSFVLNNMVGPNGHSNFNPRIIGSTLNSNGTVNAGAVASAQYVLSGKRTVTLAANPQGSSPMLVDNFILLEMTTAAGKNAVAQGSADAVPWANPLNSSDSSVAPILLNNSPITFVSFGAGGTVGVTPWDLSGYFPVNTLVQFKATGLDCGGVGQISDIYILFQ